MEEEQKGQDSTLSYPMKEISVKYLINHLHQREKVEELFSSFLVMRGGVSILYGEVKAGKTLLALQMAICASIGQPFLTFSTVPGPVLYLIFEGGRPYLLERIEEIAIHLFPSHKETIFGSIGVEDFAGRCLDSQQDIMALKELLKVYKPRYLFLDPLDLGIAGDYSNPSTARRCMTSLIQLSDEFALGVIAVTHSRKGKVRREDFNDLIGSVLWQAEAATLIKLIKLNGEAELNFLVRYGPPIQPLRLRFNPEGLFFEVLERAPREGERAEEVIIQVLRAQGGAVPLKQLIENVKRETGVHRNTVDYARHRLERKGIISSERIPGSAAKLVKLLQESA